MALRLDRDGRRGVLTAYSVFGVPATKEVRVMRRDARTGDALVTDGKTYFMVVGACVCTEDALGKRRLEIVHDIVQRLLSSGDFAGARKALSSVISLLL